MFNNKNILITGGTGSFGKKCVAHIIDKYKPQKLVIYSRDELKQYEMQQTFNAPCMRYFIGDVRDLPRLNRAFSGIDYVIHAAALKQIPAAEYNPMECIKTNIHGGQNVISAALDQGVRKVIALSTDKAAQPANLYGATKLASDKLFVAANNMSGTNPTRFSVVRYGNVIGSRGSVLPLFRRLKNEGKKILPITDTRMTRFWITLEQGVDFVIKSFDRMHGGEIFIPKIPSSHILDIAKAVGIDEYEVIGIRPGEKLHEVMCTEHDARFTLEFKDHLVIKPSIQFNHEFDYECNAVQERGKSVADDFVYSSDTNSDFLTVDEIRALM
jgi:UDP-N-acetylglucosamine 4,6-dehydratase/5-epimerase